MFCYWFSRLRLGWSGNNFTGCFHWGGCLSNCSSLSRVDGTSGWSLGHLSLISGSITSGMSSGLALEQLEDHKVWLDWKRLGMAGYFKMLCFRLLVALVGQDMYFHLSSKSNSFLIAHWHYCLMHGLESRFGLGSVLGLGSKFGLGSSIGIFFFAFIWFLFCDIHLPLTAMTQYDLGLSLTSVIVLTLGIHCLYDISFPTTKLDRFWVHCLLANANFWRL